MSNNENNNSLKDDFELREKRLNLIYKILYVLAAAWGALIIAIVSSDKSVLPFFSGIISVVTTAIINILYYIFSELRCLKIALSASNNEKEIADKSFINIWNTFFLTIVLSVALVMLNLSFPNIINTTVISISMGASFVVLFFFMLVSFLSKNDFSKTKAIVRNICLPISCYAFFAILQLPEVGTNA